MPAGDSFPDDNGIEYPLLPNQPPYEARVEALPLIVKRGCNRSDAVRSRDYLRPFHTPCCQVRGNVRTDRKHNLKKVIDHPEGNAVSCTSEKRSRTVRARNRDTVDVRHSTN